MAHIFSVFFIDLNAHLNELNMYLQGENQLAWIMFQILTAFKMKSNYGKIKLWQIISCIFICWLSTVLWAAKNMLPNLWKEIENRFWDFWKGSSFFEYQRKYIICKFSNWMYRVAIRHSKQRKIWSSVFTRLLEDLSLPAYWSELCNHLANNRARSLMMTVICQH